MIETKKDLTNIPASLNSKLTNQRRQELIKAAVYIQKDVYHSRYKMQDIKTALQEIYHSKCAFCEQKIEFPQVEHFRPKNIYYWLAYSWDNLLFACLGCNSSKNNHFEILLKRATDFELNNIHKLSVKYDVLEKSFFVNPEATQDIEGKLTFDKYGNIKSEDKAMDYTIKTCKLNREYLIVQRKKVYDDFIKKLYVRFLTERPYERKMESIKDLIQDFLEDAQDPKNEYLAFRQFIINNNLIPTFSNELP